MEIDFSLTQAYSAGQEQYHSLVPLYFRKAACVIVVYDITRQVCVCVCVYTTCSYMLRHSAASGLTSSLLIHDLMANCSKRLKTRKHGLKN